MPWAMFCVDRLWVDCRFFERGMALDLCLVDLGLPSCAVYMLCSGRVNDMAFSELHP